MKQENGVTEMDLHSYVDGTISDDDRVRLEAWLDENPDARKRVEDWKSQAASIRTLFEPHAKTTLSDIRIVTGENVKQNTRLRYIMQTAAACVIFAGGIATGHYLPYGTGQEIPPQRAQMTDISGQAQSAYLIYASEVRHPVEVGADEKPHLAAWLGKRLGYAFSIPDLSSLGFNLVGGRLVPVTAKPGAMLMYQNDTGQRITVLIGRNPQNRTTSFRMTNEGGVETFYWIDEEIGYAISGEIDREQLQKIAEECYRQFPA